MTLRDHLGPRTPDNSELHDELDRLEAAPAAALMEAADKIEAAMTRASELGREIWPIPNLRTLATPDSTAALKRVIRAHVEKALEMAAEVALGKGFAGFNDPIRKRCANAILAITPAAVLAAVDSSCSPH